MTEVTRPREDLHSRETDRDFWEEKQRDEGEDFRAFRSPSNKLKRIYEMKGTASIKGERPTDGGEPEERERRGLI